MACTEPGLLEQVCHTAQVLVPKCVWRAQQIGFEVQWLEKSQYETIHIKGV